MENEAVTSHHYDNQQHRHSGFASQRQNSCFDAPFENPFDTSNSYNYQRSGGRRSTDETEDSSDQLRWRLKTNRSSDVFEKIMVDIESKMLEKQKLEASQARAKRQRELIEKRRAERLEYERNLQEAGGTTSGTTQVLTQLPGQSLQAANTLAALERQKKMLSFEEEIFEDEEDQVDADVGGGRLDFNHPLRITARRAWAMIRRNVRERALEKHNHSNMQWSMLNQTIKNISNKNAGRQKLYEKYLNPKRRTWTDGIKSIPIDFFSKNARRIQEKNAESKPQSGKKASMTDAQMREMDKARATMFNHSAKIRLITPSNASRSSHTSSPRAGKN